MYHHKYRYLPLHSFIRSIDHILVIYLSSYYHKALISYQYYFSLHLFLDNKFKFTESFKA